MRIYGLVSFCLWATWVGLMPPGYVLADGGAEESEPLLIGQAECAELGNVDLVFAARDVPTGHCEPIGLPDPEHPDHFNGYCLTTRFRGNWFDLNEDTVVTEFGLLLQMPVSKNVNLYFSCFVEAGSGRDFKYFQRCPGWPDNDVSYTVPAHQPTQFEWYSTGELAEPITMHAGKSYVLGAAWGEGEVCFGRDRTVDPPRTLAGFPKGEWRGSVGLELQDEPPIPIPPGESILFSTSTSRGPWIMEICLAGACCVDAGQCRDDLSEDACVALGGNFTCPGLTCERLVDEHDGCPLVPGACCREKPQDCEFWCDVMDEFTCTGCDGQGGLGGEWYRGIGCEPHPCACRGACCISDDPPNNCLDETTELSCLGVSGAHWAGRDTKCDTLDPPCVVGACCVGEDNDPLCFIRSKDECETMLEGSFVGFGAACDPDPCMPTGACCFADCSCAERTWPDCLAEGGNPRGDDTRCADLEIPCCHGACCTTNAGCLVASKDLCDMVGDFQGDGESCAMLDPPCPGVCCWYGPTCTEDIDPVSCAELFDGRFAGYGKSCPSACPVPGPVGRCCLQSDQCTETTQTLCEGELCIGSVCSLSGESCTTDDDCNQWLQGEYQGDGTQCPCPPPPPPEGACCYDAGLATIECTDGVAEDECSALDQGVYQGDGTECVPHACVEGACCFADCHCENTNGIGCDLRQGEHFEPDAQCESYVCPSCAACCLRNEGCLTLRENVCTALDGSYHVGSACEDVDCSRGACCLADDECRFLTESDCDAIQDAVYRGDPTDCDDPDACVEGACCFDDAPCVETDGLECEDLGGDDFLPDVDCTACPSLGACCLPDQPDDPCEILTQEACETRGGSYVGDNEPCVVDDCQLGACCLLDGSCHDQWDDPPDLRFRFQCEDGEHPYHPYNEFHVGLDCASVYCPARGACCRPDDSCEILTVGECNVVDGTYYGTAIMCLPSEEDACVLGACCFDDGACQAEIIGIDCAYYETDPPGLGRTFIPGADCDVCPLTAACCLDEAGACATLTEDACLDAGGTWAPNVPECPSAPSDYACYRRVCCELDAGCTENVWGFECVAPGREGRALPNFSCVGVDCPVRGACCLPDESCTTPTELGCEGAYAGDGRPCAETDCSAGVCCTPDGACVEDQFPFQCDDKNGFLYDDPTTCQDECYPTGNGDFDADGDVDLDDFAAFQVCFGHPVLDGCQPANMAAGSALIDLRDLGLFVEAMTGVPGVCCMPDGVCVQDQSASQCDADNGRLYSGLATCQDACHPTGDGDFDSDGDVDLFDLAAFQTCFGQPALGGCRPANLAAGGETIDLDDLALLVEAMTGP